MRKLKKLTKLGNGIEALYECCKTKVALVGLEFKVEWTGNDSAFGVVIDRCCQHDTMARTGRKAFFPIIGWRICTTECSAWASEFGGNIRFEQGCRIYEGDETFILQFSQ